MFIDDVSYYLLILIKQLSFVEDAFVSFQFLALLLLPQIEVRDSKIMKDYFYSEEHQTMHYQESNAF